jgi:hypothetical protein
MYPRRWRVGSTRGRQLTIDENGGSGLLVTLEPRSRLPTAAQYLGEVRDWLAGQKARILRVDQPRRLHGPPDELDSFAIDAELAGQRVTLQYYVARQDNGGATFAARLLPTDLANRQKDVERIARSLRVTRPMPRDGK